MTTTTITLVTPACPSCGSITSVRTTNLKAKAQLALLPHQRPNIKDVLPDVSPEDRERFITGFCPKCWDKITKDGE